MKSYSDIGFAMIWMEMQMCCTDAFLMRSPSNT